jgi:hypothetical protein
MDYKLRKFKRVWGAERCMREVNGKFMKSYNGFMY